MWLHCGHMTVPRCSGWPPALRRDRRCRRRAPPSARRARRGRGSRRGRRPGAPRRSRCRAARRRPRFRRGRPQRARPPAAARMPVRRRLRRERLGRRIARQLGAAAEAELVVVLIVLRALRTGDHTGLRTPPFRPIPSIYAPAGGSRELTSASAVAISPSSTFAASLAPMPNATFPEIQRPRHRAALRALRHVAGQHRRSPRGAARPEDGENFVGLATGTQEWTHPGTRPAQKGARYYDGTIFHRVIPDFMIQGG